MNKIVVLIMGPFANQYWWMKIVALVLVVIATIFTQIGGVFIWLMIGFMKITVSPTTRCLLIPIISVAAYVVSSISIVPIAAEWAGRVPLACYSSNTNLQAQHIIYCLANRHYVTKELAAVLQTLTENLRLRLPDRTLRFLDAGFPFAGFPMLPHLSHRNGRHIDLMFFYTDAAGKPVDGNGFFLGYFAFVQPPGSAPKLCQQSSRSLRWDMDWLQALISKSNLDVEATQVLVQAIVEHQGIRKIFLEPHLKERLNIRSAKVRFQGCRAARHDDHLHIQL